MSLKFKQFQDYQISERVFCVEVLASTNVNETLCQGILKRIFSKQICYTYQIEQIKTLKSSFLIYFRFICWNIDGQRKRYLEFKNMPIEQMEENLRKHANKTLDGFCGEFFKRLKRADFDVVIDGKKCQVVEKCSTQNNLELLTNRTDFDTVLTLREEKTMNIEVKTVVKKLTKSLISQMQTASLDVLKNGTLLGYVVNVDKYSYKTMIFKYGENYYTMPMNWTLGSDVYSCGVKISGPSSCYRKYGKWSWGKDFATAEACETWWKYYKACVDSVCENTHQLYV